jgi:hypothetical protein
MGLTDYTISDKKYYEAGKAFERERIIELLEEFYDGDLWRQTGPNEWEGFGMHEIVELIKKEGHNE